jgi:NADH:ubiquinone oxidoreductase subunit F (NADH-binding)/ferredoxin
VRRRGTSAPPSVPAVRWIGTSRLTAGLDNYDRLDLDAHLRIHGPLPRLDGRDLLTLAQEIKLKGRGGAGFPFARKLTAVIESAERRRARATVVVNATEGEPAAWKDKTLLTRAPHLILDGAVLAAFAVDADAITIGVADDGVGAESLTAALRERRMPFPTRLAIMPHRFISGEGNALIRGINGETPVPPGRKVFAADTGVGGAPTLLSNAETYAQLAIAARCGPHGYNSVGEPDEPGTVMLSVGGTAEPCVVEVPTGTPLVHVLRAAGAPFGPVLTGGYHGSFISGQDAGAVRVSRDGFKAVGGSLGAGIILPLGEETCALGESARVAHYLAGQSAGQCGPCRLGLPDLGRAMGNLVDGRGGTQGVDAVRAAVGVVKGRGACSHPDGTSRFVLSALEVFADEVEAHRRAGTCGRQVRNVLPVPGMDGDGPLLHVDWSRCDGHGLCADVAPELIRLDGNGFPAIPTAPVPTPLLGRAKGAVKVCPALALRLAAPVRR